MPLSNCLLSNYFERVVVDSWLHFHIPEDLMLSMARKPLQSSYSVEVSGWDDSHSFFVERSELTWDEESGKHLTLSHRLCPGTMIFVRLLQPTALECTWPVAYDAEFLATTPEGGQRFRVQCMEPRNGKIDR